jgi:hypothetical protein
MRVGKQTEYMAMVLIVRFRRLKTRCQVTAKFIKPKWVKITVNICRHLRCKSVKPAARNSRKKR